MEKSIGSRTLRLAAVFGQFLALFPLAAAFCGLGTGAYLPWIFCVIYAVWGAFYGAGYLFGKLARELELSGKTSKNIQPIILFLSRAAVIIPTAVFVAVVMIAKINTLLLFYILPGGVIAYFGAHKSVGKVYSDVFSRAWFALYFILAVLVSAMLWSTHEEELLSAGIFLLCAGFAAMIILSAVLTNQTNIDVCTKQRAGGKSVLPGGLRRYNAVLITVIFAAATGLFLFAKPLAELVKLLISLIGRGILFILRSLGSCVQITPGGGMPDEPGSVSDIMPSEGANNLANIIYVLSVIFLLMLIILLRKQIWSAVKSLLEPLFRKSSAGSDIPFYDEILASDARSLTPRARRRAERELARQYRRENDPARKYRFGYALFLIQLGKTNSPPLPADTTTIHREKGERAFEKDLGELSAVYNKIRYGEAAPTAEELSRQERLLTEIR